jgi:hypothetical protein
MRNSVSQILAKFSHRTSGQFSGPLLLFCVLLFCCSDSLFSQSIVWRPVNGPYGGTVWSIVAGDSHVYAGTDGGVYRKSIYPTPGPNEWVWLRDSALNVLPVYALAVKGQQVWAGTQRGIYYSKDGETWTNQTTNINPYPVRAIIWPDDSTLYIGTFGDGIHRSDNGGKSWQRIPVPSGMDSTRQLVYHPDQGLIWEVEDTLGFFRSMDWGQNWTYHSTPFNSRAKQLQVLYQPLSKQWYAYGTKNEQFVSGENLNSWAKIESTTIDSLPTQYVLDKAGILYQLTQTGRVNRSNDGGMTWTNSLAATDFVPVNAFYHHLATNRYWAGTQTFGVYAKSPDSAWKADNEGLRSTRVTRFNWINENEIVCLVEGIGLQYSPFIGYRWQSLNAGLPTLAINDLVVHPQGALLVGTLGSQRLYQMGLERQGWTPNSDGISSNGIVALALSPNGARYAASNDSLIYSSMGMGNAWTVLTKIPVQDGIVRQLWVDSQQRLMALIAGIGIFRYNSTENKWEKLPPVLNLSPTTICLPLAGDSLIAGTSSGIYLYRQSVWRKVHTYARPSITTGLVIDSVGELIISTQDFGVWRSSNAWFKWEAFNIGLKSTNVIALAQSPTGRLLASTAREGVFITYDPVGLPNQNQQASQPIIYPNPTNGLVNITGLSPQASQIQVFNSMGQLVFISDKSQGVYNAQLNLELLPEGLYYLQLNSKTTSKKAGYGQRIWIIR